MKKLISKRLMARIRCIRPEFLAQNQFCVLNHPPYSPDLAPCDFSLFPKLKLKGCFFNDISIIKTAITRALEAIPQNELEHALKSLLNRLKEFVHCP